MVWTLTLKGFFLGGRESCITVPSHVVLCGEYGEHGNPALVTVSVLLTLASQPKTGLAVRAMIKQGQLHFVYCGNERGPCMPPLKLLLAVPFGRTEFGFGLHCECPMPDLGSTSHLTNDSAMQSNRRATAKQPQSAGRQLVLT
jgi:hypothetical protein